MDLPLYMLFCRSSRAPIFSLLAVRLLGLELRRHASCGDCVPDLISPDLVDEYEATRLSNADALVEE